MKLKILVLHKWLVMGGIEKVLLNYLTIFLKLNYDVDVYITYKPKRNIIMEQFPKGIYCKFIFNESKLSELENLKSKKRKSIKNKLLYELNKAIVQIIYNYRISKLIKSKNYDLVIDFSNCLDGFIRNRKINTPTLRWNHSQLDLRNHKNKFNNIFSKHSGIITICDSMQKKIIEQLNYKINNLFVLHNPIDIELVKLLSLQESDNKYINEKYILQVSRLVNGKGHLELIDIYKSLKENGIQHKLYFIGEGENRETLQNRINELGLEQDCLLLGEMSNPYPFFRNATLFLHTSEAEGLPTVLLESMACGTPVVAMDCPTGPKDILGGNNEFGKLIPMHDKKAFVDAVLELINDNEKYQYYCEQSLKRSLDFSNEEISQQVHQLFSKIIKKYKFSN